jgi:peroxiredoxin
MPLPSVSPSAVKLLLAVLEKNPIRPIKGEASLRLGQYWKRQAELVRSLKDDPEQAKGWEAFFVEEGSDKAAFGRFAERDPDALTKEAEAVLERTAEEFGDLADGRFRTVGEAARAELDEIRNLCAGKPAPEIAGEDITGKRFSLGDFRGKVIVISFWADWLASCRDMYKYERSLVDRMQGKPFVLLGVNGDGNRDKLRELMEREGITWQSWWDGGGDANTVGPIARRYNVHGWPTLYVLDHRGIIRYKSLGSPGSKKLDSVIDALVQAAREATDPPK